MNGYQWKQEPSCAQSGCHAQQYVPNANTLYRNSVGHGGMYCEACHGSPHAIQPTIQPNGAIQNIALQGHAGVLSDSRVCHSQPPTGAGPHGIPYLSSVCGQITTTTGQALAQVNVSTQNALAASSSITGNYSLANLGPGVYTLTPQLTGYVFVPSYRVVTLPASRVGQNFQAVSATLHAVAYLPVVTR